jgi:RNA polymerase sigma factor (sigma-70 family)
MDEIVEQLVEQAKRGEPHAAPFLVSLFGEKLLGYARAHAPDLSDADREQIVEQAIEAGTRALGTFDPDRGSLFGWFRTQVRYKTLTWRRSAQLSTEVPDDLQAPEKVGEPDEKVVAAVERAMQRLPRETQLILALRDVEQLDYAEIGQRLRIKTDTARQRHRRALLRFEVEASKEVELRKFHLGGESD